MPDTNDNQTTPITNNLVDDSQQPYGNRYDAAKRYSKVLFRPGRPAFSQELLEMESIQNNQLTMLGNTLFQEGAIISGMEIIPRPDNAATPNKDNPNLFSVSSLFANNSKINTDLYTNSGVFSIESSANLSTDVVGTDFSAIATKGLNMTISFGIKKRSGTLNRLNIDFDDDKLDVIEWTIDGKQVINNLGAISIPELLTDKDKNQINLNDGAEHKVIVKFRTQDSGSQGFNLVLNGGYDLTTTNVMVDINHMYIEGGLEPTETWHINPKDTGTPSSTDKVKNYMVKPGRVWLAGAVREFDGDNFSIKGVGKETIGLKVQERVVTSNEDPDLLDDTPNSVTRGEAGADRVKYEVKLTENDPSSTPFVVFQDNVINPKAIKPDYSNLNPILARRTYDQSGSFRSYGLEGHMHKNADPSKGAQDPDDASKILLDIDAGQAYVRGYSISTSETKTIKLDTAESTGTSTNEGFYYRGTDEPYKLLNQPVKKVFNVTYTARQEGGPDSNQNHTAMPAGANITHVKFTDRNVTYVRQVTAPYNGGLKEYTAGTDFTWINNEIHWGVNLDGSPLPGNPQMPASGQSFYVTYDYSVNATENVDYKVNVDENNETSIQIIKGAPNTPDAGTTVNVTYAYFQARIDMIRITMDQENPFKVVPGTPAPLSSVTPPIVEDPYTLELGYVLIQPNSHNATFTLQTVTRITFNDLQQWGIRLTNTEYNMGIAAMNEQVKRSEDPTYMKDAFSDDFNTIVNRDDAASTVAYDFENGEILLPSQAQADLKQNIKYEDSVIAEHVQSKLVTPPYKEVEAVSQNLATGTVNINEYDIFSTSGTLEISPSSDSWTDKTTVVDYKTKRERPVELHKAWWHLEHPEWMDQTANYLNLQGINWQTPGAGETQTGYTLSDGGSQTTESEIQYMRSNTINFTAKNFLPYSIGYTITIDGTPVQTTKADDDKYVDQGNAGNVTTYKADGDGVIKGSFVIPGGTIRCGVRTVKIVNNSGDVATTNYTAQGTLKTVTQTIEKRIQDIKIIDPLAQSFTLQEMRQVASIYLYFAQKPTGDKTGHRSDVIVQIRELSDDGYPSRTVRGEVTLQPEQIETSDDGSKGTKIVFADSITLNANQGYAICLISDSDQYRLFKASRGEKVINAGKNETIYNSNPDAITNMDDTAQGKNINITRTISANVGDVIKSAPNANGVMFTSNNAQTWTADPASSLKFVVNVCQYDQKGVVQFDPIITATFGQGQNWIKDKGPSLDGKSKTPTTQLSAVDRLAALTSYLTYQNTSMNWYYRVLSSTDVTQGASADPAVAILSAKWHPLIVNNDNTAQVQPGAPEDNVPAVTDSNDPQTVDGEINLFKNSAAFQLKAEFNSDRYIAPVVGTEDLSLVAILTGKKAVYESVDVDESGEAGFNEVKLQYDAYIPEVGTTVPNVNPMYSIDGGTTWCNFKEGSTNGDEDTVDPSDKVDPDKTYTKSDTGYSVPWASSTIENPKKISGYFKRYTFRALIPQIKGSDGKMHNADANHLAHQFKVRLNLSSPTNFRTPRVRRLAVLLKRNLDNGAGNK